MTAGMRAGRLSRRAVLLAGAAGAWLHGRRPARGAVPRAFHVSPAGDDANPGTAEQPFASIGAAFERVPDLGAGDRIIVQPGVYAEAVVVRAGGDETGDLVLVSAVPLGAEIRAPAGSYSAVSILKSHVTIDGFDVSGSGTGHGIEATFLDGDNSKDGPHHVSVLNCRCHDNAGSGISVAYGDFYRIENNVCFGNCATNEYQGSGISVYAARAVAGSAELRIVVARNSCYRNMAIALPGGVAHSDGNGIIIDDLRGTQKPTPAGAYRFRTLVENNLCHGNGGKGIHVFISDNVTVRNNTCCYNNRDPKNPASWRGELSNVDASNVTWLNNIAVADPAANPANAAILDAATGSRANAGVTWRRNLTFNGKPGAASLTQPRPNASLGAGPPHGNLLGVDPQFVRGGPGEADPDFHLADGSPARQAAAAAEAPARDRDGRPRGAAGACDLGAFESEG